MAIVISMVGVECEGWTSWLSARNPIGDVEQPPEHSQCEPCGGYRLSTLYIFGKSTPQSTNSYQWRQ